VKYQCVTFLARREPSQYCNITSASTPISLNSRTVSSSPYRMLQCIAVCCGVLQRIAECKASSAQLCTGGATPALCHPGPGFVFLWYLDIITSAGCSVLRCDAVCCCVLQSVAMCVAIWNIITSASYTYAAKAQSLRQTVTETDSH